MANRLRDRMRVMSPAEFKTLEAKADTIKVDLLAMFHEHVSTAMAVMRRLLANPRYGDGSWRNELYTQSHNLKGLGGSFDYDLMTLVGGSLCVLLKNARVVQETRLQRLLAAHVAALDAIIARELKGDGGRHGQELLATLGIEGTPQAR